MKREQETCGLELKLTNIIYKSDDKLLKRCLYSTKMKKKILLFWDQKEI